ncbi:LCP family protein [Chakrabartyella piscis]|uniref:LCP family protein n=1 Tax=Chakrabartyella piscis TaxID=2918914 RepID=UPI002958C865|nr:LCP family protein [Chakrabartyella piscis]
MRLKQKSKKPKKTKKTKRSTSSGNKGRLVTLFCKTVCAIVLAFVILAGGGCFAYYKVTGQMPFADEEITENGVLSTNASDASFLDALLKKNIKMNVAIFGVDVDTGSERSDTCMVVHFESATGEISILSIPRDTRITFCDEVRQYYSANGRGYDYVGKFNSVYAYGGKDYGAQGAVMQIEDLLGISIDHYVKVDLEAFTAIVDAIGGVEFYVAEDMYKDMSDTGDIVIDLEEGYQLLDGAAAQALVRYRGYDNADIGRVAVQQDFIAALADKIVSTETILKNLPDLISVLYEYVDTDVTLTDALKYINYVDTIDMDKMEAYTLPGYGQYIGGVSYYLHYVDETKELVDEIFYSVTPVTTLLPTSAIEDEEVEVEEEVEIVDTKDLIIEVSNGGSVSGLAGNKSTMLEDAGYQMAEPTTYGGDRNSYTRIQVQEDGIGEDLLQYFNDAKIEVAPDAVPDGVDIRIILGTNETLD